MDREKDFNLSGSSDLFSGSNHYEFISTRSSSKLVDSLKYCTDWVTKREKPKIRRSVSLVSFDEYINNRENLNVFPGTSECTNEKLVVNLFSLYQYDIIFHSLIKDMVRHNEEFIELISKVPRIYKSRDHFMECAEKYYGALFDVNQEIKVQLEEVSDLVKKFNGEVKEGPTQTPTKKSSTNLSLRNTPTKLNGNKKNFSTFLKFLVNSSPKEDPDLAKFSQNAYQRRGMKESQSAWEKRKKKISEIFKIREKRNKGTSIKNVELNSVKEDEIATEAVDGTNILEKDPINTDTTGSLKQETSVSKNVIDTLDDILEINRENLQSSGKVQNKNTNINEPIPSENIDENVDKTSKPSEDFSLPLEGLEEGRISSPMVPVSIEDKNQEENDTLLESINKFMNELNQNPNQLNTSKNVVENNSQEMEVSENNVPKEEIKEPSLEEESQELISQDFLNTLAVKKASKESDIQMEVKEEVKDITIDEHQIQVPSNETDSIEKDSEDSNLTVMRERSLSPNNSQNDSKIEEEFSGYSLETVLIDDILKIPSAKRKYDQLDENSSEKDLKRLSGEDFLDEILSENSEPVSSLDLGSLCSDYSGHEKSKSDAFSRLFSGISRKRRKLCHPSGSSSEESGNSQLKRLKPPKKKIRRRHARDKKSASSSSSSTSLSNLYLECSDASNSMLPEFEAAPITPNNNPDLEENNISDNERLLDFDEAEVFSDEDEEVDAEKQGENATKKKKLVKSKSPTEGEKPMESKKKENNKAAAWKRDKLLTACLDSDSGDEFAKKSKEKLDEAEDNENVDKKCDENNIEITKIKDEEKLLELSDFNEVIGLDTDSESSSIEFVCYKNKSKNKDNGTQACLKVPKEEDDDEEKKATGRKNIRTILSEENLQISTKLANEEEKQRVERLQKKNTELTAILSQNDLSDDENVILDISDDIQIKVDLQLSKRLKEHQKQGVKFMWDACFASLKAIKNGEDGSGCILGHCMGLGKTFQVVTLIHTLFHYKETGIKRVMVVCPLSTVQNWNMEIKDTFERAKEKVKFEVFVLSCSQSNAKARISRLKQWKKSNSGILLMGYETFIALEKQCLKMEDNETYDTLVDSGPQILFCDEGHLLKNGKTNRFKSLIKIKTLRKVLLTGTPMQNNLIEYFYMVQFVKPNLLGTFSEFSNRFVGPINNGQYYDSTESDIKLMKERSHILHDILKNTVQRYEVTELQEYLPQKKDFVIFVQLSPEQIPIYQTLIEEFKGNNDRTKFFSHKRILQALCSHPLTLHLKEEDKFKKKRKKVFDTIGPVEEDPMEENPSLPIGWWKDLLPDDWMQNCNYGPKFMFMTSIIEESDKIGDKVLIFSSCLILLDAIEAILKVVHPEWIKNAHYLRMDGTVLPDARQAYCDKFNNNKNIKLFLLSTMIAGLGLNLVAANRVILMDVGYNPSQDLQSVFRVYRFGQKKRCYIYRMVAKGTMEEVIYERAVTKQAISARVVDDMQISRHYKSEDITSFYRNNLDYDQDDRTHNLPSDEVLANSLQKLSQFIYTYHEHETLLSNVPNEELDEMERAAAWAKYNEEKDRKEKEMLIQKSAFPYNGNLECFMPPLGPMVETRPTTSSTVTDGIFSNYLIPTTSQSLYVKQKNTMPSQNKTLTTQNRSVITQSSTFINQNRKCIPKNSTVTTLNNSVQNITFVPQSNMVITQNMTVSNQIKTINLQKYTLANVNNQVINQSRPLTPQNCIVSTKNNTSTNISNSQFTENVRHVHKPTNHVNIVRKSHIQSRRQTMVIPPLSSKNHVAVLSNADQQSFPALKIDSHTGTKIIKGTPNNVVIEKENPPSTSTMSRKSISKTDLTKRLLYTKTVIDLEQLEKVANMDDNMEFVLVEDENESIVTTKKVDDKIDVIPVDD